MGPHNTNQNCNNFVQTAFADMGDSSHHMSEWDAYIDYLSSVSKAIHGHVSNINFTDPASIRQSCDILVNEVSNEAMYICNKYKIKIEPMQYQ